MALMSTENNQRRNSDIIKVGNFIAENYPVKTRIMSDFYTYVPPRFTDNHFVWGPTWELIEKLKPDLITINVATTGRWVWKQSGTTIGDQKFVADVTFGNRTAEMEVFLRSFLTNPGWKVVFETPSGVVFARTGTQ